MSRDFQHHFPLVVVVSPSGPLRGVASAAQLSAEAGVQGRHHAVVLGDGMPRVDCAQLPEPVASQCGAPQQDVSRGVRLLPAPVG